jgi:hypothetical protein
MQSYLPEVKSEHFFRFFLLLALPLVACLEPTRPAFQIEDSFYLVEGRILAGAESEIRIRESNFREVALKLEAIVEAEVVSVEAGGPRVEWELVDELKGSYHPPSDFLAFAGQRWHFEITLADGTLILSDPETIPEPVVANNLDVRFVQESTFDEGRNRFIPRFELYLDYDDPADQKNYYAFDYTYWEKTNVCISCENSIYRNGECLIQEGESPFYPGFDYSCEPFDCYTINPGLQPRYGNDEFTNGGNVTGVPLGGIEFQAYGGLLMEGQLISISREAYNYGKVIQDLSDGSSGLNATIPAALNGNVRNANPDGRDILGFIAAANFSSVRLYLERTLSTGAPLQLDPPPRFEGGFPPRAPCDIPGVRTSVKPTGWP